VGLVKKKTHGGWKEKTQKTRFCVLVLQEKKLAYLLRASEKGEDGGGWTYANSLGNKKKNLIRQRKDKGWNFQERKD